MGGLNKSFQKSYEERASLVSLIEIQNHDMSPEDERLIMENFKNQMIIELRRVEFLFFQNTRYYHIRIRKMKEQLEFIAKNKQLKDIKVNIEIALKELFKELMYMRSYIELNLKAKSKIMKKFTKYTKDVNAKDNLEFREKCLDDIENVMNNSNLSNALQIISIQQTEVEKIFGDNFFDKYSFNAIKILKDYGNQNFFTHLQAFYFGFFVGLMVILLILCILIGVHFSIDMDDDAKFKSIFPMFRGYLVFILYYWYLGLNVYAWNMAHINYKLAFAFNDNHYSDVISIFKRAAFFSFILVFMLLCYMILRAQIPILSDFFSFIPLEFTPMCCWIILLIYLFAPLNIFNYLGRIYFGNLFVESMASVTHKIEFKHIWFTDQLTSLIGPLRDLEYTACYYTHYFDTLEEKNRLCSARRPIVVLIACYPHFVRFLQCARVCFDEGKLFPSILNCGKYLFSILLAVSSYYSSTVPFFSKTWLLIALMSSIYSYSWDIKMDYGMLQQGPNFPLRNKLSYSKRQLYYVAMVLNLFMRFAWALTISPDLVYKFVRPEFFLMILYLIEMFRRGMWNFIRVELKHIEICKDFKVCPHIPLPLKKTGDGSFKIKDINVEEAQENPTKYERLRKLSSILESSRQLNLQTSTSNVNLNASHHSDSLTSLNALGLKSMEELEGDKEKSNYKEKFQSFLNSIQQESENNLKKYESIAKRVYKHKEI